MSKGTIAKERLAQAEYCLMKYFLQHIAPVMDAEKNRIAWEQGREIRDYQNSLGGFLRSFAAASSPGKVDDSLQYLKTAGDSCSVTDEDYLLRVCEKISGDNSIVEDLGALSALWGEAVVCDIGQERYEEIGAMIGGDLALAYVDSRMEELMLAKMAHERMPRSAADYVIRKGAENSIFGLPLLCQQSPLETMLYEQADAIYNASDGAKFGARAVSAGVDIASMGGAGSWSALAGALGFEGVLGAFEHYYGKSKKPERGLTVDECVQKAAWGEGACALSDARREYGRLSSNESEFVPLVNESLKLKMAYSDMPKQFDWEAGCPLPQAPSGWAQFEQAEEAQSKGNGMPLVIAPGQEKEYLEWKEREAKKQKEDRVVKETAQEIVSDQGSVQRQENPSQQVSTIAAPATNHNGWSQFLQAFGLDGVGEIGRNLPYVLATLPDMLIGLFTGKTESVGIKKDMIPLASILLGLFIKNPLLKMLLIGMGGANLINKMSHEAIDRQEAKERSNYKAYADEPLNERIREPAISGNVMVATIDGVPCQVILPENAAKAYAYGTLPLNTLANAVLAKHDQGNPMAWGAGQTMQRSNDIVVNRQSQLRM